MTGIDDAELLSAHPGYSEIQDGIEHLDGSGCMWSSAEAIRLLDAQNNARGREIDRASAENERLHKAVELLHCLILRDLPNDGSEIPQPDDPWWAAQLDRIVTEAAAIYAAAIGSER